LLLIPEFTLTEINATVASGGNMHEAEILGDSSAERNLMAFPPTATASRSTCGQFFPINSGSV